MSRRRQDKFVSNIVQGRRNRQRRKRQRSLERASGRISAVHEGSENLKDHLKSGVKEIGLLGLETGKGVAREFGSLGVDILIAFSTLGLAGAPSSGGRKGRRRRRC